MPEYELAGRDGRTVSVPAPDVAPTPARQDWLPSRSMADWTRLVVRGSKVVVALALVGGLVWSGTAVYRAVMDTKQDIEQTLADPLGGIAAGLDSATGTQGGSLAWERRQAEERQVEARRQREAEAEAIRQQHGIVMVQARGEVPEDATVHVTVTVGTDVTDDVVLEREPIGSCGYGKDLWSAQPVTLAAGQVWEADVDVTCGGVLLDLTWGEDVSRAEAARIVALDVAPNWERPDQSHLEALGLEPDTSPLIDVTRDGVEGADR